MPNATGGPCVNYHSGKHSYIVVIDPNNSLQPTTDVDTVEDKTDSAHVIKWTVLKLKLTDHNKLRIRLKGQGLPAKFKITPPDSGTLTITLKDSATTPPTV